MSQEIKPFAELTYEEKLARKKELLNITDND